MLSFLVTFSTPWIQDEAAKDALDILQYVYPIALLFFFIFAFTTRSILTTPPSIDNEEQAPKIQYGPAGKPLPIRTASFKRVVQFDFSRSRKLVFEWLSAGVCLTWIGNAAVVIVHALYDREDGWWCGQPTTVSFSHEKSAVNICADALDLHCWIVLRVLTPPHLPHRHQTISNRRTIRNMGPSYCCRSCHILAGPKD
jgi:hypothetical protein